MATVKLSGLRNGRVATVGDTDSALIDGSLTIGDDINEDTITVNAEFTSDLIPDVDDTYDLGSSTNKWRIGYFDQVDTKLRDIKVAYYNYDGTDQRFIRFNNTGVSGDSRASQNSIFVAPTNGSLVSVQIRTKSASNLTNISFHKDSNGTSLPISNWSATETQSVNITNANQTYTANFSSSDFTVGQILGISIDPTNKTDDVNITIIFMFDWN